MPVTIQLDHHPVGYVLEPALGGESVHVRSKEFTTSEDGNDFISRLEGVSDCYHAAFEATGIPRARVESFLGIVTPSKQATVYLNELELVSNVRVKGLGPDGIKAGEPVYMDHIADVEALELFDTEGKPVMVPADCGFSLVLSVGWRKGLFFDYSVFGPHAKPRTDNLPRLFGHLFARLLFQEVYSVTDAQWERLFNWGWFPFVGLKHVDRKSLLSWANYDREPRPVLEGIARNFVAGLGDRLAVWERYEYLKQRMPFLTRARERLEAQDYLSCVNLVYPQIEGVMRSLFVAETTDGSPQQGTMVSNLVENQFADSVLLPNRFEAYLKKVYFRAFDERGGSFPLSRHTVSHGVSEVGDYDFLRAAIGFLVLDQLVHYLSD